MYNLRSNPEKLRRGSTRNSTLVLMKGLGYGNRCDCNGGRPSDWAPCAKSLSDTHLRMATNKAEELAEMQQGWPRRLYYTNSSALMHTAQKPCIDGKPCLTAIHGGTLHTCENSTSLPKVTKEGPYSPMITNWWYEKTTRGNGAITREIVTLIDWSPRFDLRR